MAQCQLLCIPCTAPAVPLYCHTCCQGCTAGLAGTPDLQLTGWVVAATSGSRQRPAMRQIFKGAYILCNRMHSKLTTPMSTGCSLHGQAPGHWYCEMIASAANSNEALICADPIHTFMSWIFDFTTFHQLPTLQLSHPNPKQRC